MKRKWAFLMENEVSLVSVKAFFVDRGEIKSASKGFGLATKLSKLIL